MQEEEPRRVKESLPLETHSVTKTEEIKVRAYRPVHILINFEIFQAFQQKFSLPSSEYCIESV